MAIGRCAFDVCQSVIATNFRGVFLVEGDEGRKPQAAEILLCPHHARGVGEAEKASLPVYMSREGLIWLPLVVERHFFVNW